MGWDGNSVTESKKLSLVLPTLAVLEQLEGDSKRHGLRGKLLQLLVFRLTAGAWLVFSLVFFLGGREGRGLEPWNSEQ